MKKENISSFWSVVFTIALAAAVVGCGKKTDSDQAAKAGIGERSGIAVDTAASNAVEAARNTVDAAKEVADDAAIKTGEALEKAGDAMKKAGENMQK